MVCSSSGDRAHCMNISRHLFHGTALLSKWIIPITAAVRTHKLSDDDSDSLAAGQAVLGKVGLWLEVHTSVPHAWHPCVHCVGMEGAVQWEGH